MEKVMKKRMRKETLSNGDWIEFIEVGAQLTKIFRQKSKAYNFKTEYHEKQADGSYKLLDTIMHERTTARPGNVSGRHTNEFLAKKPKMDFSALNMATLKLDGKRLAESEKVLEGGYKIEAHSDAGILEGDLGNATKTLAKKAMKASVQKEFNDKQMDAIEKVLEGQEAE